MGLSTAYAQVGGENAYEFLNLPSSARAQYLGRAAMACNDGDISLLGTNPALLSDKMQKKINVSSNFFFGANANHLEYVQPIKKIGNLGMGVHQMNYGPIEKTDEFGRVIGSINPMDLYLNAQYATKLDKYTLGANAKLIYSNLGSTSSYGCAVDIAIMHSDSSLSQTFGFLIKNLGGQVVQFNATKEPLPFDIQFAYSKRFKHLPFRLTILAHDLYRWDITYDDPDLQTTNSFTNASTSNYSFLNNAFRHLSFSGEFYFGKVIRVGIGYDHQKRTELIFETNRGLAGFSFGFGIVTRKFDFGYSIAKYSPVGASNHFSLVLKFNEFLKK